MVSGGSFAAASLLALTLAGCVYTLYAVACARRFFARAAVSAHRQPGVTHLKPLATAEVDLADNLSSFRGQRYSGPVQILLGVGDPQTDAIARGWAADGRRERVDIVDCSGPPACANPKIAKLVTMEPYAAHEVLVLSDSDIVAGAEDLSTIVGELYQPGVGAVTCLYHGIARRGLWARLAALQIDHHFLPSVLVGEALGLARPCFGSTIALTRDTLKRIGGFAAFGAHLADDHAIGAAVRRLGASVRVSRAVVGHVCAEPTLRALVLHELRWARTVRALDPRGFAGSIVAHPLPLALAALACALPAGPGYVVASLVGIVLAAAARAALAMTVDAGLQIEHHAAWLGPVRDILSFSVFVASFFVAAVTWRGRRYRVAADGTVVALVES